MGSKNPKNRYANGHRRRQIRAWLLATQDNCALCGRPIDKTLKTPHPMSPEVDEIIPVSRGGSPIDRNNVQLVHRCCNLRKGNGSGLGKRHANRHMTNACSREW